MHASARVHGFMTEAINLYTGGAGMHKPDTSSSSAVLPTGTLDSSLTSLILAFLPQPLEIAVDPKETGRGKSSTREDDLSRDSPALPSASNGDAQPEDDSSDNDRPYDECLEIRCDLCGKAFSHPSTLNRHLREIHKQATTRKEQAMKPMCGEILRSQSLALRHRREVHGSATAISRLGTQCSMPGCDWAGQTHRDLVSHAQAEHATPTAPFEWQSESFDTKDHFERWLDELRKQGVQWYSRSSKTVDGVKQEYRYCRREIGGRGKKEETIRTHCTSYIKLLLHDDSSVSAEFCLDHLGHVDGYAQSERELLGDEMDEDEEAVGKSEDGDDMHDIDGNDDSLDDDVAGPSNDTRNRSDRMPQLDSELTLSSLSTSRSRLCRSCGKEFSCGSTLYRHLREVHKEDHPKCETLAIRTPCSVCGEIFPSGSQMRAHRSTAHPGSIGHRMNCPIDGCEWNGSTHRDLIKHAHSLHSTPSSPFLWQTRSFLSQTEFNEWLEEERKRGVHFYIRRSEKRRSLKVENRCCYFEENRARGVASPTRQRNKFSRKSVCSCTCYLTLTIHDDGSIAAGFCLDHLGHTVDLDARPFRIGSSRDGRDEDEDEEEDEEDDEEEPIEEYANDQPAANGSRQPATAQELRRFQEALAPILTLSARLRYSHEINRLSAYLEDAFVATGLDVGNNASLVAGGVKRPFENKSMMNGSKRVKREDD
ncbi:hypothetical protein PRIPAC_86450 [Pristionchus pacificus]|uniref:Zinc finger protein n=1 Tax=Pristionchus pacificus TaxID=54126 RepID=A0A2A6BM45_PRIPA|nr:hypothetical protein PRIPAC_86450 [Pristionchus pacificus]|eukprot:PDM66841.1 zinc finger protein [Pristionchus pacificus]